MKVEIFSSFKDPDFENVELSFDYLKTEVLNSAKKFFKDHPKQKKYIQVLSGDKYFIDFKITL